jgi:hypothetical protein
MDQATPDMPVDRPALGGTALVEPVSNKLCQVLATSVDVHRCLAAQALGRIGHPSSIEALIAALLDEDVPPLSSFWKICLAIHVPASS